MKHLRSFLPPPDPLFPSSAPTQRTAVSLLFPWLRYGPWSHLDGSLSRTCRVQAWQALGNSVCPAHSRSSINTCWMSKQANTAGGHAGVLGDTMQPVPAYPGPSLPCMREKTGFAVAGTTRVAAEVRCPQKTQSLARDPDKQAETCAERSLQ